MVDAGVAAALHIMATGCTPIVDVDVQRALYRLGGDRQQIAVRLHDACMGGAA